MRDSLILAISGTIRTGKSTIAKSEAVASGKRIIVLNPKKEISFFKEGYEALKIIDHEGKKYFSENLSPNGKYQFFDDAGWTSSNKDFYIDFVEAIDNMKLRNTVIIFDEASTYMSSFASDSIRRMCVDIRRRAIDLIFVFHSVASIPNMLLSFINFLYVKPSAKKFLAKQKQVDGFELIQEAQERVNNDLRKAIESGQEPDSIKWKFTERVRIN